MNNQNDEEIQKWRKKYHQLFKAKFWATEILFLVLLLAFWSVVQNLLLFPLGIPDNEIGNIISFLVLASIITTINEYIHCRKGCELEMYDNIAKISFYAEQNYKLNKKKSAKNTVREEKHTPVKSEVVVEDREPIDAEDVPDWYKTLPNIIEAPFDNAQYETMTDDPISFDPITYLEEAHANTDIIENLSVKLLIKKYYRECANCITEYVDYSIPRSERRQESVKIEGHNVNIAIEISTTMGISYLIKISFTVE